MRDENQGFTVGKIGWGKWVGKMGFSHPPQSPASGENGQNGENTFLGQNDSLFHSQLER